VKLLIKGGSAAVFRPLTGRRPTNGDTKLNALRLTGFWRTLHPLPSSSSRYAELHSDKNNTLAYTILSLMVMISFPQSSRVYGFWWLLWNDHTAVIKHSEVRRCTGYFYSGTSFIFHRNREVPPTFPQSVHVALKHVVTACVFRIDLIVELWQVFVINTKKLLAIKQSVYLSVVLLHLEYIDRTVFIVRIHFPLPIVPLSVLKLGIKTLRWRPLHLSNHAPFLPPSWHLVQIPVSNGVVFSYTAQNI
jgi:hypothetical protein